MNYNSPDVFLKCDLRDSSARGPSFGRFPRTMLAMISLYFSTKLGDCQTAPPPRRGLSNRASPAPHPVGAHHVGRNVVRPFSLVNNTLSRQNNPSRVKIPRAAQGHYYSAQKGVARDAPTRSPPRRGATCCVRSRLSIIPSRVKIPRAAQGHYYSAQKGVARDAPTRRVEARYVEHASACFW